jgi:Gram-negative bacterial TonB protein C-terminal
MSDMEILQQLSLKSLENHAPAVSIHSMRLRATLPVALLAFCEMALGQAGFRAPCEYGGELLHQSQRRIRVFTSDEMKARATQKHDIQGMIKQADLKGTAIVDVLVAPDGHVVCTRSLIGHPLVRASVEDALRKWKFSPAEIDGRRVAYVGRMEFTLCNISCGDSGPSMSIIK